MRQSPKPAKQASASPLQRIYAKQKPKLRVNTRQTALLKTFAEDDYKRIALLIKKWLDESDSERK